MSTILDDAHARWSFVTRVTNLRLIILDLQSDISRALATRPAHDALLALVEVDARLQVAITNLDAAAAAIQKVGATP